MVGAAAGLARRGRTPIVHALSTFPTLRAFELVRSDVGIPGLPVKLVGLARGLLSEADRPTHQAIDDVALMRAVPGMQVFCPADLGELVEALPEIVGSRAPAYVRYTSAPAAVEHVVPFSIGKAEVLSHEEGRGMAPALVPIACRSFPPATVHSLEAPLVPTSSRRARLWPCTPTGSGGRVSGAATASGCAQCAPTKKSW